MGHWRCFTFKSLQLSHSIPTTPPASPMHTPTSWLAPYQCSQQWWGWVLQLVSKHTNFCFTEYAKGLCGSQQTVENSSRDVNTRPLTCLLRNLFADQEATDRTGHGTIDCFPIGKGICQGCILSSYLFNFYSEYIMRNSGLDETQVAIKIARRNINNLRCTDDTTLMAESEEELNSLMMKVKKESEKSWLKAQHSEIKDHGIWSHHFMGNRGGNIGNGGRLFWVTPKSLQMVTAALKLKDPYFLEEVMTKLDSILKSRDITLPTNICLVKAMVFPVIMYGCESWTIKKGERRRIDAFRMWCWRRLLRVLWTGRRSNQSILQEINP